LRRVRGKSKIAYQSVIRKVFEHPVGTGAREKRFCRLCGKSNSHEEHPMWPWWIDVLLSAGGVAIVCLAVALLAINRLTRGMNVD
jgi:hypothetical protein